MASYRLHQGARTANIVLGVALCVLVVTIPLAIWMFVRSSTARVTIDDEGLAATNLFSSTRWAWREVARLGSLRVRIVSSGGLGGALAKQRVGGDYATHLLVKTVDGKTRSFMVSAYEDMDGIVREVLQRAGKPLEALEPGMLGVGSAKWPNAA